MKHVLFFSFLLICFSIFSCSHNPYQDFQKVAPGMDKAQVLDIIGSPLRSKFQDGRNIWTYRFYSKAEDSLVYKDVILDSDKVLEVRNAKEVDIKEIIKKEKMVEQSLKETVKARDQAPARAKPVVDDSILNESSKQKNETFVPVE